MSNPTGLHALDFDVAYIYVRTFTDVWGPYSWTLTNNMPSGDTVSAVTFKAYMDDDTSSLNGTDTSALLIEAGSTGVTGASDLVYCKFQYPGASYIGYHRVEMQVTFTSGAKQTYKFGYVKVEA